MIFNFILNSAFLLLYFINNDPFVTFLFSSLLIMLLYFNNHIILDYYYPRLSFVKKTYIITNIVKSISLFILLTLSFPILQNIYYYKYWDVHNIKNLGSMYASLDFSSFFYNKKMSTNTIYHHLSVILFFIINLKDTYSESSISRLIMLYAIFSSVAFHINLLLGIRYLVNINSFTYKVSSLLYLLSSVTNWLVQFYFIINQKYNNIQLVIYLIILKYIISDDIMLLKWLQKKSIN